MDANTRQMPDIEMALMRRGVEDISSTLESCDRCHRSPLIGERVYAYASGKVLCELCRALDSDQPLSKHLVHGPEFGHTMKIIDQRPAA